jgi:hypothetical protein
MSSIESFDELEQKIKAQVEEALGEVREEFLARLESTGERLDEVVNSEMATAREAAESVATAEAEEARAVAVAEALEAKEAEFAEMLAAKDAAIAEAEEAKAGLMAEIEETKQAIWAEAEQVKVTAIAEALDAKQNEFNELLAAKDATIGEVEEARAGLMAEVEEAKQAIWAEAEEAKAEAIAEALEAKQNEFNELLAAKDAAIADLEQARESALAEAAEEREAAVGEARSAAEQGLAEALDATLQGLHQTIARIDAAQTQTDVLEALLAGSAGYASRALVFLTREDGLQGWGGQGFDTEHGQLQDAHLDYEEGTAWSELAEGRGTIELSDDACEVLCKAIDGSQPREGVLIPMVLRDRLAATLYADRLTDEDPFHLLTLQILAYVTGQALESLPMRTRTATATLRLVTEAPAEEPGLELWQFLAPAEPLVEEPPMEEPIPVPAEPEDATAEEVVVEPEPVPEAWKKPEEKPEPDPVDFTAVEETGFQVEEAQEKIEEPEPIETTEIPAPPAEVAPPVEVAPLPRLHPLPRSHRRRRLRRVQKSLHLKTSMVRDGPSRHGASTANRVRTPPTRRPVAWPVCWLPRSSSTTKSRSRKAGAVATSIGP